MSDNVQLNSGTGGDIVAADDIAGVKHQRVKIEIGDDGEATDVSSTNPLPTTVTNVPTVTVSGSVGLTGSLPAGSNTLGGLTALGSITAPVTAFINNGSGGAAINIQDGGNSITVDGTVGVSALTNAVSATLLTGANTIGNIGTVSTITNVVHVDDNSSTISIDDGSGSITIDGTVSVGNTVVVSGTVTADAGTGTFVVGDGGGSISIDDNSGSITVDGTVGVSALTSAVSATLLTGTNSIGNIGTVSTITNVVHVDDNSSTLSIDDGNGSITIDGNITSITSAVSAYVNNGAGAAAVNIQDGGNSITVDGTVGVSSLSNAVSATLLAGTNSIGNIGTVSTITNVVHVDDNSSTLSIDDGNSSITIDGTVGVSSIAAAASATLLTGSNTIGSVKLTDGTDTADVLNLTSSHPLTVAVVDGSGDQITSFGGGTQYTEGDTDTTITGTALIFETNVASSILGVVSSTNPLPVSDNNTTLSIDDGAGSITIDGSLSSITSTVSAYVNNGAGGAAVNIQDGGNSITVDGTVDVSSITSAASATLLAGTSTIGSVKLTDGTLTIGAVDETGASAVDALAVGGGTPHDSIDSGNPVKFGSKAASALPTAITDGDRANAISDLNGRVLVSHIDPLMQIWKQVEYTTAQTGTAVWTPANGKKIAVTSFQITTGGTTAGVVTLWFGSSVDTTFTQGTDQVLFRGEFAPSSTQRPGALMALPVPIVSDTASNRLRITTSAAMTVYVTVVGYEI